MEETKKRAIVLLSGGVSSTCKMLELKKEGYDVLAVLVVQENTSEKEAAEKKAALLVCNVKNIALELVPATQFMSVLLKNKLGSFAKENLDSEVPEDVGVHAEIPTAYIQGIGLSLQETLKYDSVFMGEEKTPAEYLAILKDNGCETEMPWCPWKNLALAAKT